MNNITRAVKIIGGQTKLGRELGGVTQGQVWDWMNKFGQAPARHIRNIAALTNHQVTVEQLLQDHEQHPRASKAKKQGDAQ